MADWQQPLRPLIYTHTPPEDGLPEGFEWKPMWMTVLFIRPTEHGYQIMGVSGVIWDNGRVLVRERTDEC